MNVGGWTHVIECPVRIEQDFILFYDVKFCKHDVFNGFIDSYLRYNNDINVSE
jgi:hypothetical protein